MGFSIISKGIEIANLVFPGGVLYNKKNHEARTQRVDTLFAAITVQANVSEKNKNGDSMKNRQKFSSVHLGAQFSNHFIPDLTRLANLLTA